MQERRRILESQTEANNAAETEAQQREEDEQRMRIQQVHYKFSIKMNAVLIFYMHAHQWHQRIREDLANSVPDEPPNGHVENISVRVRLPTGEL